jgi:uncharacterized protein YdeI (YjbR/CyaY-like superfamily)
MQASEQLFFSNRNSFRLWLEEFHDKSDGFWMIYYKKHTGLPSIEYSEALEEALCFGWIDSLIKKIDQERYVRKFTPRTDLFKWSEVNKRLVMKLVKNGRMTEAGLNKIEDYAKTGKIAWQSEQASAAPEEKKPEETPEFILKAFAENEPALSHFNKLAPSYRRHYIMWIMQAKREETQLARISEAVMLLKENRKLESK